MCEKYMFLSSYYVSYMHRNLGVGLGLGPCAGRSHDVRPSSAGCNHGKDEKWHPATWG